MTAPLARSPGDPGDDGDLAARFLAHADWMVSSGQFRGTAREYLGFLHPYPARDEALRILDEREQSTAVRPQVFSPDEEAACRAGLADWERSNAADVVAARDGEEAGDGHDCHQSGHGTRAMRQDQGRRAFVRNTRPPR